MKIHPKSYSLGYVRGCSDEREQYRAAAFAAIRRAAEIAREHDLQAKLYRNDEWERWRDIEELQCARAVRAAIRAAIGSEKT